MQNDACLPGLPNELRSFLSNGMEQLRDTNAEEAGAKARPVVPGWVSPQIPAPYPSGYFCAVLADAMSPLTQSSSGVCCRKYKRWPRLAGDHASTFLCGKRIAFRKGASHFRAMHTVQEIGGRREIQSGFREKPCEEEL